MTKTRFLVARMPDGQTLTFVGRFAWALACLVEAGEAGCTPIDHPGPRWSHYVFVLRRAGIAIATITQRHGGPYPGHHARYVLRTLIVVVAAVDGRDAA